MMKLNAVLISLVCMNVMSCAQDDVPDRDIQIKSAIMAAPEEQREGSAVWGYNNEGELVMLKEGTNNLMCIADDPNREGFQVVCYHKDLDEFMARGRELKKEGKTSDEIFAMREEEAKAGSLTMPEQPTTLHLLEGREGRFDESAQTVVGANYRYVVYIPWATAETTGLPTSPVVPGGPWIMDPGTHRAHIMISVPPTSE